MRKHIREIMRCQAEKNGYKPSKAVHTFWYRLQEEKVGHQKHLANIARGTRKKHNWKLRYGQVF